MLYLSHGYTFERAFPSFEFPIQSQAIVATLGSGAQV